MEKLVAEYTKVDKISQRKRLLYYAYFFIKMQENSVDEVWNDFEKLLNNTENWVKNYESFFENDSIDDEKECVDLYYHVTNDGNTSSQNVLIDIWRKVKDIIKKEIDCEKELFEILNKKADDHPIISKIIIVLLSGILTGLVEGCILDAIQNNKVQKEAQTTNIYIMDEDNRYKQISYDGNEIVIKEIKQELEPTE